MTPSCTPCTPFHTSSPHLPFAESHVLLGLQIKIQVGACLYRKLAAVEKLRLLMGSFNIMLQTNPIIHPDNRNRRFKFEPFLRKEYNFGTDPDRPVCQFFLPLTPNSCPNGNNCPHKHVAPMYNNKIVCKHWLRGLCKKNDHCEFLHEYNLRKMPECLFYSRNGYCTQTNDCLYLHVDPQLKIPECPNYLRGFCPEGPKCVNRHVRKIMCPLYLTGFCPKGLECEFSHPRFDNITDKMRIKSDRNERKRR